MSEQEEQAKEAIELMSSEIQPPDVSLIRGAVQRRQQRRKGIRYAAAMGVVVVAIAGGFISAGQLNDRTQEVVTAQPAQGETEKAETTTSLAAVTTTVSSSSSISDDAQGTWGLESITSGSEQVEFSESLGTRARENVPAWLELNESGGLSGEVLCNDFRGSYEFDGQLLRTSGVIASAVGCGEGQEIETLVFDRLWGDAIQVSFTGDDSNVMTWSSADVELTFIRMSDPSANEPTTTSTTTTSTTTTTSLPEVPTSGVATSCTVRDESLTFTDSSTGRIESGDESEVQDTLVIELDLDEDGMPESIYYHDIRLIRGEVGTSDENGIRVGLTTVCSGDVRLAESVSVHEKNASKPFIIDDSLWLYFFEGPAGNAAPVRLQDIGLVESGPRERFWYNSECDGSGLIEPDPDVPPAVSETRSTIAALAAECDVEGLLELVPEALIELDEFGQTVVSNFGTGLLPPEAFSALNHGWFDELLAMEGFEDVDGSWVFPKLAATACSDLTDSDISVIDGFTPMGVSFNCEKFGEFVSAWLRISADGEWIEYQIGVYGSGR